MKNLSLEDYNLVPGTIIKAVRFNDFWPDYEIKDEGEEVALEMSHTVDLVAKGQLWGSSCHKGYVFHTKYGDVTLCALHSWGSSDDSRYGDVFGHTGYRLIG